MAAGRDGNYDVTHQLFTFLEPIGARTQVAGRGNQGGNPRRPARRRQHGSGRLVLNDENQEGGGRAPGAGQNWRNSQNRGGGNQESGTRPGDRNRGQDQGARPNGQNRGQTGQNHGQTEEKGGQNRQYRRQNGQNHGRSEQNRGQNDQNRGRNGQSQRGGEVRYADNRHGQDCNVQSARNNNSNTDFAPRKYPTGYNKLAEFCERSDEEVLATIANSHSGFMELIAGQLRPDLMVLVIKILAKACRSAFRENKGMLLASVCACQGFLDQVSNHMMSVFSDTDPKRKAGAQELFKDLFVVLETVIEFLPTTACECLGKMFVTLEVAVKYASEFQGNSFEPSLLLRPAELKTKLLVIVEKEIKKPTKSSRYTEKLAYQQPPDDFRLMSIFPMPEDILSHKRAFIRPNIIDGAYDNVDHYLDIQFRLLREDFVQPLREGIMDFIASSNQQQKKRINNIRVCKNVHFEQVEVVMDNMGYVVVFDPNASKTKSKVKWEYSKRFMFGSLLCFTQNNFQNVFFATVLNRDLKQLEQGKVVVQLSSQTDAVDDLFQSEYVMAESEVYFEPYFHVLTALQRMSNQSFPMAEYIVNVQADSQPPLYVTNSSAVPFKIQNYSVLVLRDHTWPSAAQLELDPSQYQAFKAALTKEFVVIQGPPGTGKTYLGLKIARTLLVNVKTLLNNNPRPRKPRPYFYPGMPSDSEEDDDDAQVLSRKSPMLVVCFTNHALDQFLEGLLVQTRKIIRVGGQSKSEVLKEYNLKEQRRLHNTDKNKNKNLVNLSRDIRARMSRLMAEIKGIQQEMECVDGGGGVISISCVAAVFSHRCLSHLDDDHGRLSDANLLLWLNEGLDEYLANIGQVQLPQPPTEMGLNETEMLEEDADREDELWQRAPRDELELDRDEVVEVNLKFCLELKERYLKMDEIKQQLEILNEKVADGRVFIYDQRYQLQEQYVSLEQETSYLKQMLKRRKPQDPAVINQLLTSRLNLWAMSSEQRWTLYHHWLQLIRHSLEEKLMRVNIRYCEEAAQHQEARQMEDLQLMRGADVVGMTTTGAARLQTLLQALKSRIVIVEEAAEVMESHIITSLTSHCQHLILIGDHEQLRPTTAVYKLATDYNFDISLFERMLKNGLHCEMLTVQHRMRPEIAQLIVPAIYEKLENHPSVLEYEHVRGVTKSLFFLDHKTPEKEVGETNSRSNPFEADTLLALCRYLLLQGYEPSRVTLLTTYSGQLFYMRKERMRFPTLRDMQITIVDNFQGEENDIIVLSLVRNNDENNVGFLKIKNRVCVALSRAKHGMFIMGNMDNLTSSHRSEVWPQIKEALQAQKAVGDHLTLQCQIHPEQLTRVKSAADFSQVPEGGCRLQCDAQLVCGHRCKSICHANDRDHKVYRCHEPCTRIPPECALEHLCVKLCADKCGLCRIPVKRVLPACEHSITLPCHVDYAKYKCMVSMSVKGPLCGHEYNKPCHRDLETFPCPYPCDLRLPCGHSCERKCHADDDVDHLQYKCKLPCAKKNTGCVKNHTCARKCWEECGLCMVEVQKQPLNCDHVYKVACSSDREAITCVRPCRRILSECGHPCKKLCNQPCGDCSFKVKKIVPECTHEVTIKCCEPATRKQCNGPCTRLLTCGHQCMRRCRMECSPQADCNILVPSTVKPACGHNFLVPCNINNEKLAPASAELLVYCTEQCTTQLKCGHQCAGTCGTCLQGRIHQPCQEKCGRVLVCGHECKVACAESCPPCTQKCGVFCQHSRCNQKCGVPCKPCKMKCRWRCVHSACRNLCNRPCSREPCYEPCQALLPCKHPCIGFCGEPCPPLCRICDEEEVTTLLFGNEDEPDARFVYLRDCKHTIESEAVDTWLGQANEAVTIPTCPLCKTPIMTTLRFMNQTKEALKDVVEIKKKIFGNKKEIEEKRLQILDKLKALLSGRGYSKIVELVKKLVSQLDLVRDNRRNQLSRMDLEMIGTQANILNEIHEVCAAAVAEMLCYPLRFSSLEHHMSLLVDAVAQHSRMSAQEVDDFNLELRRLQRIVRFCELDKLMRSQPNNKAAVALKTSASDAVFRLARFDNQQDINLKELLKNWATAMNTVPITEKERQEIVAAMGFEKGHWYKCPNGHLYTIGDCGGATVTSNCPVEGCGEKIGGAQHRLLESNQIATEMDGATMSAYDMNVAVWQQNHD